MKGEASIMNDVIEFLKEYISKNGFEILSKSPFEVYKAMIKGDKDIQGIDQKRARLILITLMSKTHEMARKGCSSSELTDHIQTEHFLVEETAKDVASLYLELFGEQNVKTWDDARELGFKEFCKKEWTVDWDGDADWHTKHGGSYPCSAYAHLTFTVRDAEKLHDHLSSMLKSNPFLSADEIYDFLSSQIEGGLDNDMQEYCDADDYYEPYWDEFVGNGTYDSEKEWKSWGLEILEFTGSGDIDYELW